VLAFPMDDELIERVPPTLQGGPGPFSPARSVRAPITGGLRRHLPEVAERQALDHTCRSTTNSAASSSRRPHLLGFVRTRGRVGGP